MKIKKIIEDISNIVVKITPKKSELKDIVKKGAKSRTVWFNIGIIVVGIFSMFSEEIKTYLNPDGFSKLLTFIGVISIYLRKTTITPKGHFGRDEDE